jgi:patatin-like phospholipase/acyl hydrolase
MDGGGIFGVHTAVILQRLEAACPGFIEKTDLFAGTSIGGMIGLILAAGFTPDDAMKVYTNAGAFFTRSWCRRILSKIGLKALYDNTGRQQILSQWLGTTTLGQLKKYVVVQSFDLNASPAWDGVVFHNIPATANSPYPDSSNMLAVDAGMATSAAPMYFPSYGSYVDGGVASNNPATTAITMTQDKTLSWPFAETPIQNVKLFSIGRTYAGDQITTPNYDGGYIGWLPHILEILLTGNQSMVNYEAQELLGDGFFRHNGAIPASLNVDIDDASAIPALIAWSQSLDLTNEIAWIKANWF